MKKFSFLRGLGYVVIISSMAILLYGAYNIYSASREVKETLEVWNDKKTNRLTEELPIKDTVKNLIPHEFNDDITTDTNPNTKDDLLDQQSRDDFLYSDKVEISDSVKTIQYDQTEYGDVIGEIRLNDESFPIITGIQDNLLNKGVLHYGETILPGLEGNSLLLGHRDSVFKRLGHLKMNQTFEIQTLQNSLSFEIIDIKILKSDDMTVFDNYGFPTVSLVTCYPFNFLASRTERYVVVGKLITY